MEYQHLIDGSERQARALLTYLTEPNDTIVGSLLRDYSAIEVLEMLLIEEPTTSPMGRKRGECQARVGREPVAALLARAALADVRFVIPGDLEFPVSLTHEVMGVSAPIGLWVKGIHLPLAKHHRPVGVVGSRAATTYGEHVTMELVSDLARFGHSIVSGAAYGIDGAAHRAAMASGAPTVAFLAGGVDRPYPAGHSDLLSRMVVNGSVVSEMPPGSAPTKWRFLQRNRLIAAASTGVLIVEAGYRSGAINTAGWAEQYAVPVMAVPGPITSVASAGCHRLIAGGATLVTSAADIERVLP